MIEDYVKQLKPSYLKGNYNRFIQEAMELTQGYEEFLNHLLSVVRSGAMIK